MAQKLVYRAFLWLVILANVLSTDRNVRATETFDVNAQSSDVTAYDLILATNTLRVSYGNSQLVEDPIVNAVAQTTAEIMAANQMSWHIGDVRGRLASAGYGGGSNVWATENFAYGNLTIDEIMVAWSDESHMLPVVNSAYCNVGAGVAKASNGMTYYVLQAAYVSGKSCGDYTSPGGGNNPPPGGGAPGVPQIIIPVKIAAPDADGKIFHVVEAGQSLWAIAIAYKITIKDLEYWNNISRDWKLQIGQRLFIPNKDTLGYATPTPIGMVQLSAPDQDGKIIHEVQAYQTLTSISQAYKTNIQALLNLNGIQADWPLRIGQRLLINPGSVTPSPTPRPLTPIEKLTPASDGKYYHSVKSGETLSWIASLYNVRVADLMAWNGLSDSAIFPEQKLVLQVTPPATLTPTAAPMTTLAPATITSTPVPTTLTPTAIRTLASTTPPSLSSEGSAPSTQPAVWVTMISLVAGGLILLGLILRKR